MGELPVATAILRPTAAQLPGARHQRPQPPVQRPRVPRTQHRQPCHDLPAGTATSGRTPPTALARLAPSQRILCVVILAVRFVAGIAERGRATQDLEPEGCAE